MVQGWGSSEFNQSRNHVINQKPWLTNHGFFNFLEMQTVCSFKFLIHLVFFLGLSGFCFSQEKIEKEVSVKAQEVPSAARVWLKDAFESTKNPRWFMEYSQAGKSFEAKFRSKDHFYSVEFDSVGNVQDVEIEIDKSEIASEVWQEINAYFDTQYEQVKVEKIQRQYTGSPEALEDFFDEEERENLTVKYEIVFQGKKGQWELWEALFDDAGRFESILKVQIRPNDNLIF